MCWFASRSATCTFPGHWYTACSGCKVPVSLALLFLALQPLSTLLTDGCPAALLALENLVPAMLTSHNRLLWGHTATATLQSFRAPLCIFNIYYYPQRRSFIPPVSVSVPVPVPVPVPVFACSASAFRPFFLHTEAAAVLVLVHLASDFCIL